MSRFFSEFVHSLEPYVPGEQPKMARLVKLNTNENPYGPSDKVLAAINACADERLRLYPDPDSTALRAAAAEFHGVAPDQVFVGNGSDEVLAHLFHGFFTGKGAIAFPDISYSFYKVYCGLYGIDYDCQPLTDDFAIDLCAYPTNCGGIIFPNPNAPTGRVLPLADIRALLERCADTLVVVDEAYIDFGGESAVALVKDYDNLLVTQTLSKSRSLAGLRVGLAIGQRPLIDGLERIKNSFNSYPIDRVAEAAAVASFQDREWFQTTCQRIIDSREALVTSLTALGFAVLPSAANFVFARHNARAGAELAAALRGEGVIVRHFARPERIADYLRITVGSEAENRALLDALRTVL